jgi:hypothetical protein
MHQRKLAHKQIKKPPAALLAKLRQGSGILITHGQGAVPYGQKVPATVTAVTSKRIEFRLHNQRMKWSVSTEGFLVGTDGFFAYLEAAAPCDACGETPDRVGRCGCDY